MTQTDTWTIKRLLDWTTEFFKSRNLDTARLSAEILLAEALGCQRIELYTRFETEPEEPALAIYRDWVKRHAKGEPVAYLVGYREFYSLRFEVNPSVLIPRPESEHIVIAAIDAAKAIGKSPVAIADIGTGSGCLAIAIASHIPHANIVATDISEAAITVAARNAESHNVCERIEFAAGDLLEALPSDFAPDIIVSNPPYIGTQEKESLDASVVEYEPESALFAGETGDSVIVPLVAQSAERLQAGGYLIFETSPLIFDRCLEIVAAKREFSEAKITRDLAGHRRVIMVQRV